MSHRKIAMLAALVVAAALLVSGGHGRVVEPPYLVEISNDIGTTVALVRGGRIVTTLEAGVGTRAARSHDRSLVAWIDIGRVGLRVATAEGRGRAFVPGVQSFSWSPTGHRLLIAIDKGSRLKVLDLATGQARDVTPRPGLKSPSVFGWVVPDTIVYSQTSFDPHCRDLGAADVSGAHPRRLATVCTTGALGGDVVRLSPDGRRLLVVRANTASGRPRYTVVDVARGTRSEITGPSGTVDGFWAPGGRIGLVVRDGDRERLVSVGRDGRSTTTLAAFAAGEHADGFLSSPDDRRLAFVATAGSRARIVTVDVNGQNRRTIGASSGRRIFVRCWLDDGRIAVTTTDGLRVMETRDRRGATLREVFRAPRGAYLIELSCS